MNMQQRNKTKHDVRKKPQNTGSLKGKMLQLLGIERAYVRSVGVHEEEGIRMDVSLDYIYSTQIENPLLEAERKKAKALMEMERQRMRMF